MTVLHYTGSTWDGGGILAVIRQLAQTEHYRSVLGVAPGFVQRKEPPLPLWEGPAVADETIGLGNLGATWRVARQVRRWLREDPARVFHGHSRAGLLVGLWLHFLGERRVVVSVHCYGRHRWFYRWARRRLGARLVWLSPAMRRHYGYADAGWAGCIPNGLARTRPAELRRWPGGRALRIGGAGMLTRWKRWDLVLSALAALPADCAVDFFHIGGAMDQPDSRAYEQELRAQADNPALRERVHWLGWQNSSAALLGQVDAVVVPSDGESFSMIALEALFAGVPVIASRGGGPEDFIREGENGWLVAAGDAAALAQRLELCCEPRAWSELRVAPEQLRPFSVDETLAPRWAEVYASVCRS